MQVDGILPEATRGLAWAGHSAQTGGTYGWQPKDLREEIRQELQNTLELYSQS